MAGSPSAPSPGLKRRRGSRSVSGCLTCRRRRVKCAVQTIPCDNCRRLNLTCTSSFHSNFKNFTPTTETGPACERLEKVSELRPTSGGSLNTCKSGVNDEASRTTNVAGAEDLPQDVLVWLSTGLSSGQFELPGYSQNTSLASIPTTVEKGHNTQALEHDNWNLQTPSGSFQDDFCAAYYDSIYDSTIEDESTSISPAVQIHSASNKTNMDSWNILDEQSEGMDDFALASSSFDFNLWGISPQMSQVYGNSHGQMPLLNRYERSMPTLLTSKTSPWNPYNYMLNSTRGTPDSPLRHGILSWTCSYLSCREQNPEYSGAVYYVSASNSVQSLISDLGCMSKVGDLTRRNNEKSEKLYMLLSTAFFLSQCDLMLCNYQSLYDRLSSIKGLFEQHWDELKASLNSLDCRLLVWLAYIDLRASLFGNQKCRRIENAKQQQDLLSVLIDLNALPSLRVVTEGRSYLSDCYGDSYPKKEIEEDMIQEPCHIKCDDVLSIFGSLNAFESWNEKHPQKANSDPMVEELRNAKIQALRANISRIRAECTVIFCEPSLKQEDGVDRTTFHALTVTALHLSATIILNRIVNPDVRTDIEAQAAAHELIRIAYRLRKTKYLDTPRSLIWPLPIFIAGIETTDEIYQDWILLYMTELEHFGTNIKKARELLERIILRQQREGRRVRVREVMDEFDVSIII